MQFQHIVTGELATASVKAALNLGASDILNMDDDLSVGPLTDVDAVTPIHRAAFWRKLLGPQAVDYERADGMPIQAKLATTSAAFHRLAANSRPCLAWCGTGADEQLTLRRVAYFLRSSSKSLWVVEVWPADQKPLPTHWSTTVSVLRESELAAIYERRRELTVAERATLAQGWLKACADGDTVSLRNVMNGHIVTHPITAYDARILAEAKPDWQHTVEVVGNAMAKFQEHEATDIFIFWRLRELAKRGHVEIDSPDAEMRGSKIRLSPTALK